MCLNSQGQKCVLAEIPQSIDPDSTLTALEKKKQTILLLTQMVFRLFKCTLSSLSLNRAKIRPIFRIKLNFPRYYKITIQIDPGCV